MGKLALVKRIADKHKLELSLGKQASNMSPPLSPLLRGDSIHSSGATSPGRLSERSKMTGRMSPTKLSLDGHHSPGRRMQSEVSQIIMEKTKKSEATSSNSSSKSASITHMRQVSVLG